MTFTHHTNEIKLLKITACYTTELAGEIY